MGAGAEFPKHGQVIAYGPPFGNAAFDKPGKAMSRRSRWRLEAKKLHRARSVVGC